MRREAAEGRGLEHTGPEIIRGFGPLPPPNRQVLVALEALADRGIVGVRFHGANRTNFYFLSYNILAGPEPSGPGQPPPRHD